MKKQALVVVAAILMMFVVGEFWGSTDLGISTPALAAPANQLSLGVITIDPASAPNDLGTSVTITGTDFTTDPSGTPPTASLGKTALTNVNWVNGTTLTASVPWGMDPGVYTLTVVNPDGGTGSLANAFTVTQGIGQWNGGNLFGGSVSQILMKPGDPNTLYAPVDGVIGLYRSQDAGEHWTYISADVGGGFAIDPLHPDWLYGLDSRGLHRSKDEGASWTTVMPNIWPDGRSMNSLQVYVSPHDPQVLFVSSSKGYGNPFPGEAFGLIKSTNGGTSWHIVADMEGLAVQDVTFDPTDSLQMVLATSDARVFRSGDGGDTWSEVTKPPLSTLGYGGVITYNPYRPTEVWIAAMANGATGIYKSTDAAFSSWKDVTPADGMGAYDVKFMSADSVYTTRHHSVDGGLTWQPFGPMTGMGEISFDPTNQQIFYVGDETYGVQKTTDGGQSWDVKNQGLTGMVCGSMDVSRADPLRVYAVFGGLPGIYRSNDGANNWTYLPIPSTAGIRTVREDPFDPQRIYVAGSSFYVSTDRGENWSDLGWNLPPSSPTGMVWAMEPDPFLAGHLLVGEVSGSYGLGGTSWLYSSSDHGVSWQAVSMPQDIAWISDIAFDLETPGLVYLTTNGTGVYRSTDSGTSWVRIDDPQQPDMQYSNSIAIATHPQHMLLAQNGSQYPYRSLDGGATWKRVQSIPSGGVDFMFADEDSNRLYYATGIGLFFSSDGGDSWEPAAGALGTLQIRELGYADADGHTILYAATSGGAAGTTSSMVENTLQTSLATASNLVGAGIYRYVKVPKSKTLYSLGAQDGWVLESSETSNKGGSLNAAATTFNLGDNKTKKQYRGILSFSTGASLPDTAVITGVTLKIKKSAIVGSGNPVSIFRGFMVDIKKGFFGTAALLQVGDFQVAANKSFGPFTLMAASSWYSIDLTGAKAYINKLSSASGLTQIRLRFKLDDNNNAVANYLSLFSGNASVANRPQLIITYYVP